MGKSAGGKYLGIYAPVAIGLLWAFAFGFSRNFTARLEMKEPPTIWSYLCFLLMIVSCVFLGLMRRPVLKALIFVVVQAGIGILLLMMKAGSAGVGVSDDRVRIAIANLGFWTTIIFLCVIGIGGIAGVSRIQAGRVASAFEQHRGERNEHPDTES